jgi:hypothetical protein
MKEVKIKILNGGRGQAYDRVKKAISQLDPKRCQASIESQQLSSVGLMPDPNYQVIDMSKMTISDALRIYAGAKNKLDTATKYVIIGDTPDKESVQARIDRDQFTRSLKDLGLQVMESEESMASEIQEKYHELGMSVDLTDDSNEEGGTDA